MIWVQSINGRSSLVTKLSDNQSRRINFHAIFGVSMCRYDTNSVSIVYPGNLELCPGIKAVDMMHVSGCGMGSTLVGE
jgi:hypothetical protein